MENAVKTRLQTVRFAEPQIYKNIAIVPLIAPADGAFLYNTLGEALADSNLAVTEVSTSGSVPELMVKNRGDRPVLLVDGEELAGAKQNRVLNTSILIKETCEIKIPVSCTEQGRWAYSSPIFSESGHILAHKIRSKKSHSVHQFLESFGKHQSDQGEVWREIQGLHAKAGSHSPTAAMSDVYKAREESLRQCDEIFKAVPNQVGILVFIGGVPAGADLVSLTSAYAKLHPKLVRSYTLEGLLDAARSPQKGEGQGEAPPPDAPEAIMSAGRKFLDEIMAAEERQFPSIGHGTEFRYRSVAPEPGEGGSTPSTIKPHPANGPQSTVSAPSANPQASTLKPQPFLSGSALVHANEVIHAAFFRLEEMEQSDRMASYRSRRSFHE